MHTCFCGQYIQTMKHDEQYLPTVHETKCFIRISFPDFDLCNVHLTAYDSTG
jgi:hypothetical protein